uniref:Uncharacterized protein n=1 Tax=Micrurus lemniscatus lemniscatus TaxID=129467 RepID=A0A2D4J5H2_MICLE
MLSSFSSVQCLYGSFHDILHKRVALSVNRYSYWEIFPPDLLQDATQGWMNKVPCTFPPFKQYFCPGYYYIIIICPGRILFCASQTQCWKTLFCSRNLKNLKNSYQKLISCLRKAVEIIPLCGMQQ